MREAGRWTGVVVATTLSGALWVGAEQASVEGRADVGDTELYYQLRGRGRTVVLLHGGLLDGRMWDGQFELLAQTYRVLRYDARGHGRSGPIEGEHCHYRDLHVLLATLGIEKATLVGLSLGARTAVDFTLEHPDMVEALVAVAPGISGWRVVMRVASEWVTTTVPATTHAYTLAAGLAQVLVVAVFIGLLLPEPDAGGAA